MAELIIPVFLDNSSYEIYNGDEKTRYFYRRMKAVRRDSNILNICTSSSTYTIKFAKIEMIDTFFRNYKNFLMRNSFDYVDYGHIIVRIRGMEKFDKDKESITFMYGMNSWVRLNGDENYIKECYEMFNKISFKHNRS